MTHDDRTPPAGSITLDERLSGMDQQLADINRKLDTFAEGSTVNGQRLRALEAIIYGALGIVLIALLYKGVDMVLDAKARGSATTSTHTDTGT